MIKNTTQSGQISSKPRIIKVFRSRPKKNQCHHLSIPDIRSNTTIHTSIGLSNSRTGIIDNRIKSIIGDNSIEKSQNRIYSILGNKTSGSLHSHSHPFRNQVGNDNGTNDLNTTFEKPSERAEIEENGDALKKNTKESASKVNNYQNIRYNTIDTGNRSNLQMTDVVPRRLNLSTRSNIEHRKKNEKRQKMVCNYCRCSRLCMFLSAVAAILFLTAIAAAVLTSLLNKSNTTTTTTTATTTTLTTTTVTTDTTTTITTATTTITYVPTGIYALQIPTCATWNQTGITVAGNANGTAGTDLGSLYNNAGIFVDNNYTLYVSDRDNDRIMKYVTNSTTGIVVAGTGLQGSGPTELNQPKGVAVDQMGALIVADSSNYRIQRFPLGSFVGTTIASNSSTNLLGQIRDLHIDVNNGIYVTDSDYSRIVKYVPNDAIGVILAGINGSGSAANQFLQPFGNFIDGNQTLYVADDGNSRVQMWLSGATSGSTVAGVTNSSGSSLTQLNAPLAVIVDNNGYIYIVDQGNNRIIRWTTNYAAGGTCIVGCTGSAGVAATQLMNPRDLKFDASGNLYVSDQGNNRVQKFLIQISPNCTATSSG